MGVSGKHKALVNQPIYYVCTIHSSVQFKCLDIILSCLNIAVVKIENRRKRLEEK